MLNFFLEQVSGMSLKNPKFLVPGTTSHSTLQKSELADLFLEQLFTQVLKKATLHSTITYINHN